MDRIQGYRITYVVVVFAVLATTTTIVDAVPEYVEASRGVRIRGPEEGAGRVEVLVNGQWGTVCDVDFDLADANVICRQLGFRSAIEAIRGPWFGPGVGPIWMSRVACRGNEPRFSACSHARRHRCSHENDVGVTCRDRVSNPDELEWDERRDFGVRLRGETAPHFGYVEVLAANGRWGRVCPDGWGTKDARVVCGQLGYRKGKAGVHRSWNKSSKTPRNGTLTGSMTNVRCNGSESSLVLCQHPGFGNWTCKSPGAASVICRIPPKSLQSPNHHELGDKQVRLRGSSSPWEGRVEVRWEGEWHKVCDHGWDIFDASVVCRQLGYGSAYEAIAQSRRYFGQGFTRVLLANVRCRGKERKLLNCTHDPLYSHNCRHWENAGVRCHHPPVNRAPIRLVGGPEGGGEGRVEILKPFCTETRWISVCGDGWNAAAGAVVCRQLGLGFVAAVGAGNKYGNISGRLAEGVRCAGWENALETCWNSSSCTAASAAGCKSGAAYVVCKKYLPDLVSNFQLTHDSLAYANAVQRLPLSELTCAWEENCLSASARRYMGKGSNMVEARQFHYRYLLRFTVQVLNFGTANFLPIIAQEDWIWHVCHMHYHSFENFATYDLLDASGERVAEGHKASYCLEDGACVDGGTKEFLCAANNQGISVNCADTYNHDIDCQWIDITDVPFGNYTLVIRVNPSRLTAEMDYVNNVVECSIGYYHRMGSLDMVNCRVGQ